jgi:aminopeptidase N
MDIRSIATSDGQDLTGRLQYIQPDDGNAQDRTLAVLRLYEPVEPGQKISLQIEFRVQLPFAYARMGYVGDFVMAGQWFPKLAAYETAGMRGRTEEGWNMHQYHGNSEFYADFGMYNVQIAVPEPYTVAATGFPTGPASIRNGMKVYRFYADDVHDFAWAASPHFVVAEEPFSSKHVPGVKIRLYLDPAHAHLKDRYLYVAKKALARYSEWYGSYPYSTLSIVVPPPGGNGAGGMEYPNLITAWAADDDNPDLELERVVAHEIAHQFWYGMVANNEFEEAWLDEGLTSYAEDKFMQAEFGVRSARMLEASYITDPAPLKLHAWEYGNHNVYAENVYMRAKLVLLDIERKIGEKRMNDVLRRYFQEWRFRHPSTGDFQQVLERVTGKNWDDYFNQYVYGGRMADVAVQSVRSAPVEIRGETVYDNRVIVDSRDGAVDNVTVRIQFADGSRTDVNWDGAGGKTEIRLLSRSPVKWVLVDPQFDLVLENRRTNNFYQTDVDEKQKVRLNVGISKLIEAAVGWIAW